MKQLWVKIITAFTAPTSNKITNREDLTKEQLMRIRRKMEMGTWKFSWARAGKVRLSAIHPDLPELITLIRKTASSIDVGHAIPLEAKRSRHSNLGLTEKSLKEYLADHDGLYQDPRELVSEFIAEGIGLCESLSRVRNKSQQKAESYEGQCVYLLAEVEYLASLLL